MWLAVAEVTETTTEVAEMLATAFETDPASVLTSPLGLIGPRRDSRTAAERRAAVGLLLLVIPGDKAR